MASRLGREIDAPNSAIAASHWIIATRNELRHADMFVQLLSTRTGLPDGSPLLAIDYRLRKIRAARAGS